MTILWQTAYARNSCGCRRLVGFREDMDEDAIQMSLTMERLRPCKSCDGPRKWPSHARFMDPEQTRQSPAAGTDLTAFEAWDLKSAAQHWIW